MGAGASVELSPAAREACIEEFSKFKAELETKFGESGSEAEIASFLQQCGGRMKLAIHERWLSTDPEEILEPELQIVDAHHHLWDYRAFDQWPYPNKLYMLEEFGKDAVSTGGHNIKGTVYVQCGTGYRKEGAPNLKAVGEVEFCESIYLKSKGNGVRVCWGCVGSVDLHSADVEEALIEMKKSSSFKGVRATGPYDEDFRRGMAFLDKHGLVMDRWHSHSSPTNNDEWIHEIDALAALASDFPNVTIVMNHLGGVVGPNLTAEEVALWKAAVTNIASSCSNVYCKLGGIQMAANGWKIDSSEREVPVSSEQLADLTFEWYSHAITAFGPSRCMFESNFPVDRACVSYRTLWNSFKRIAQRLNLSKEDKAYLFSETAQRVYHLES